MRARHALDPRATPGEMRVSRGIVPRCVREAKILTFARLKILANASLRILAPWNFHIPPLDPAPHGGREETTRVWQPQARHEQHAGARSSPRP